MTNVEYVRSWSSAQIPCPLMPVRTTGVTAAVVERMELALKQDVLNEIREGQGRLLLHDEVEIKPGHFEIVPVWETVKENEIKTPKEIYDEVIGEGFQVDYLRVAIVSYCLLVRMRPLLT